MLSHIVLYKVNRNNPDATSRIIEVADRLLRSIPGVLILNVDRILPSYRAVMDSEFQVGMNLVFESRVTEREYQKHPNHLEFVRFVLKGYMLKGSQAENPEEEFIEFILNGSPGLRPEFVRNPDIPEDQVVWAGEVVYQIGE